MAYIRKQFGKWQVNIRKKGFPGVYKAFHDVKDARKFTRDVESQMERGVFEDYSGARGWLSSCCTSLQLSVIGFLFSYNLFTNFLCVKF